MINIIVNENENNEYRRFREQDKERIQEKNTILDLNEAKTKEKQKIDNKMNE